MIVEELKDEEMYCLCAPDGSLQISTLAPDFEMCVAFCQLLGEVGISEPLVKMFKKGFKIMPVKVTILQNGDENKPFQQEKRIII